jgi:DNA-binding LacI/PurR family transcriptional regulator
MLMVGDNRGQIGPFAPHRVPLVRSLEDQCRRSGLAFCPHLLTRELGDPVIDAALARTLRGIARGRSAAGVLICLMHMEMNLEILRQAREALAAPGVRGVLLDDSGGIAQSEIDAFPPQWERISMTLSDMSGYAVGQFLLKLGHRRVAFVHTMPPPYEKWAARRLAGLQRAFRTVGLDDAVMVATPQQKPDVLSSQAQVEHDVERALRANAGVSYIPRLGTKAFGLLSSDLQSFLLELRQRHARGECLAPLLARVLADREVSAIVASSDNVADVCLDQLAARYVAVPGRLSLVSFDNTELALERQVSSYDFNTTRVASLVVSSVLKAQARRRARARPGPVEIQGFVVERATTGVRHTS